MTPAPDLGERTDIVAMERLCASLAIPGTSIPRGADIQIAQALLRRDFDPLALAAAAWQLMCAHPQIRALLDAAWTSDTAMLDKAFDEGVLVTLYDTPLLQAILKTTPLPDLHFECLTKFIRKRLLKVATRPESKTNSQMLNVASGIAINVFLTEYVYAETESEKSAIERLHAQICDPTGPVATPLELTMLGAYRPLLPLYDDLGHMQSALEALQPECRRVMIDESRREKELVQDIPAITPIRDSVSTAVQEQYEDNPYPRWVSAMMHHPVAPEVLFQTACAGVDLDAFGRGDSHRLLFAGCGTGKIAIEEGALWENAQVLALDLSCNALAYGLRRAEELGLQNITFAQGDLLNLPEIGQQFDYISSSGVLHHMADPVAGWRALASVCRPGGVMRVCLYSELARMPVRHVQALIGRARAATDASNIKKVREDLIERLVKASRQEAELASLFSSLDMYTTSMCRDLLFHVHEKDFTIPQLAEAIDDLGLRFCGFVDPTGSLLNQYRAFAPHDPDGLDLGSWHDFEVKNPRTFAQMYDVMVQKPL